MKNTILILAAILLTFSACKKDEPEAPTEENPTNNEAQGGGPEGTLRLNFIANADGAPFVLNQSFTNIDGYCVKVEKLKFYLSYISVMDMLGNQNVVWDVDLMSWEDNHTSIDIPVDTGSYTGVMFGLGVPSTMNVNQDPSVWPNSHPLSIFQNMHWNWSSGYIFTKFEGKADTTAGCVGSFDQSFVFHTGADTLFRTRNFCNAPFQIMDGQVTDFNVDIDINQFFYNAMDTIDLKVHNSTHTVNDLPLAIRFTDLMRDAFSSQ